MVSVHDPVSIVVSLDMARKLQAAGWPQENTHHFWHHVGSKLENGEGTPEHKLLKCGIRNGWFESDVSFSHVLDAPTAEEILRKLPGILLTLEAPCVLEANFFPTLSPPHVTIGYSKAGLNESGWRTWNGKMLYEEGDTLANAAAAMYVFLAEQKLLS